MDFGVQLFENPTSIYNDFEVIGVNNNYINPIVIGMGLDSQQLSEIEELKQEGWRAL